MIAPANVGPRPQLMLLRDGGAVVVRALHPTDVPALCRLLSRCSEETLYRRFMVPAPKLTNAAIRSLVEIDHRRHEALVALHDGEIVAVARYVGDGDRQAEVAVLVEDAWQKRGLGTRLVGRLARVARVHGFDTFTGTMLAENRAALRMLTSVFPTVRRRIEQGEMRFLIPIDDPAMRATG